MVDAKLYTHEQLLYAVQDIAETLYKRVGGSDNAYTAKLLYELASVTDELMARANQNVGATKPTKSSLAQAVYNKHSSQWATDRLSYLIRVGLEHSPKCEADNIEWSNGVPILRAFAGDSTGWKLSTREVAFNNMEVDE